VGPTIGDVSEKMFIDSKSTFNAAPLFYLKSNAGLTWQRAGPHYFYINRIHFEIAPTKLKKRPPFGQVEPMLDATPTKKRCHQSTPQRRVFGNLIAE
jgi:hypothetical protein